MRKLLPITAVLMILGLFAWTGVEVAQAYPYPLTLGVAQQYCHGKTDPPAIANGANSFGGYSDYYDYGGGSWVIRQQYYHYPTYTIWYYNCRVTGTQDSYNNIVGISYWQVWAAPNWAIAPADHSANVACYYYLYVHGGCNF